eukprot:c16680_g1_i1.p1 GENE.c16680_g1_i1~~c16680_g1_i1.p1  ORF type:complete len:110 (+),score=9.97 c16680_g1_i1:43-330(+)
MSAFLRLTRARLGQFPSWHSRYHCKTHKGIEDWAHKRENLHLEFQPTARNVWRGLLWGVGVPVAIYKLAVYEQEKQDEVYLEGSHRQYWGGRERD